MKVSSNYLEMSKKKNSAPWWGKLAGGRIQMKNGNARSLYRLFMQIVILSYDY